MAGILANLGGNPLNTAVGQKIEQATDASLVVENWALNMEICDVINETDEGPKDAVKAIRKRLQQNMGKNYTVVLYTLTVLETCVKNCGRRFHLLISQKDFIMDLVKLIGPKNGPPLAIQERILSLIQSWADAFHGNPEMQGVVQSYQELKQKGIEFPMTDLDTMAPIITPQRTVHSNTLSPAPHVQENASQVSEPTGISPVVEEVSVPSNAGSLDQEQLSKLRSELDIVQCNMKVFSEMLTELTPGHEHVEDLELLQELHKTLCAMQRRIVELIDRIGVEDVTNELLRVNDELNNLFLRYERYEKKQQAVQSIPEVKQPMPIPLQTAPASRNEVLVLNDKPLIDFGESTEEVPSISAQLQGMNLASGDNIDKVVTAKETVPTTVEVADEFDMFAQSRNVSYEANKIRGSSYADNTDLDHLGEGLGFYAQNKGQPNIKDNDVQDVSRWLNDKPAENNDAENPVPNPDFENFLAERAAAAERLPDVSSKPADNPIVAIAPQQVTNRRQIEKENAENALFTL